MNEDEEIKKFFDSWADEIDLEEVIWDLYQREHYGTNDYMICLSRISGECSELLTRPSWVRFPGKTPGVK